MSHWKYWYDVRWLIKQIHSVELLSFLREQYETEQVETLSMDDLAGGLEKWRAAKFFFQVCGERIGQNCWFCMEKKFNRTNPNIVAIYASRLRFVDVQAYITITDLTRFSHSHFSSFGFQPLLGCPTSYSLWRHQDLARPVPLNHKAIQLYGILAQPSYQLQVTSMTLAYDCLFSFFACVRGSSSENYKLNI